MGDSHVGLQARLMSQALRKLAGTLNRTDTICIFTNQLREKIGVMFGSPETTPGGRALKFYASVRLDIRRIETLKEGTEAFGNRVRVKVVKNKVAPPFKQAEFDIIYGSGISWEGTVLDVGLERKIVHEVGLVLHLRRRAARSGPPERDGVPDGEPRPRAVDPRAHPGRRRARADRLGAAAAARRRRRASREAEVTPVDRGGAQLPRSRRGDRHRAALRRAAASPSSSTARAWRTFPVAVVVEAGLGVGLELDRTRARALARARRRRRGGAGGRAGACAARALAGVARHAARTRRGRRHGPCRGARAGTSAAASSTTSGSRSAARGSSQSVAQATLLIVDDLVRHGCRRRGRAGCGRGASRRRRSAPRRSSSAAAGARERCATSRRAGSPRTSLEPLDCGHRERSATMSELHPDFPAQRAVPNSSEPVTDVSTTDLSDTSGHSPCARRRERRPRATQQRTGHPARTRERRM